MPPEAVAFDLDYTLVVPERDRETLLREAVDRVDAPDISREAYLRAHDAHVASETREPIFDALLTDRPTEVSPESLATAYRDAIESSLVPVADAERLVTSLAEEYRVGLLTDGPVQAQTGKLAKLGWTDLFDATVVTGSLPAGKPDERTFRTLLSELGVDADRTVYVGDHPEFDVAGAKDAGLLAVQVLNGADPHPRADATVDRDSLARDLPGVIASLG